MAAEARARAPAGASGRRRRQTSGEETRRAGRAGFTLLEILLAVALIGLLSAALVSGAISMIDGQPRSPEEVFWAASRAARKTALRTQQDVRLSYDAKEKRFVVSQGDATQVFPVQASRDLTVDLLQGQVSGRNGSVLIGGQLVETQTLPDVLYFADGTCAPFRVQFRTNGPANLIAIDPWTCAPMLPQPNTP